MVRERLVAIIQSSPLWCSRRPQGTIVSSTDLMERVDGLDFAWYFRAYRRLWSGALRWPAHAAAHYRLNVAHYALSPNLAFDEFWYRQRYPEIDTLVRSGGVASAWEHYLERGCLENRNPAWWFDEGWYQHKNPEVYVAVKVGLLACGFEHYLLYGIRQDLSPSLYFDVGWYRRRHLTDVESARYFPVVDYLLASDRSARCPVQFFDSEWYRATYLGNEREPGTCEPPRWQSPYEHYLFFGRHQQSSPSPKFNERAYRELNPDAVEKIGGGCYLSGFEHYINEGAEAGASVTTHFGTAGVDYAGPAFLRAYERSLRLNLQQLKTLKSLVGDDS